MHNCDQPHSRCACCHDEMALQFGGLAIGREELPIVGLISALISAGHCKKKAIIKRAAKVMGSDRQTDIARIFVRYGDDPVPLWESDHKGRFTLNLTEVVVPWQQPIPEAPGTSMAQQPAGRSPRPKDRKGQPFE